MNKSAASESDQQSRRQADSKAKILAAASELFLQGGAAALGVRAIARRAGLSTMGIYSHFDGKQGILDALYIEGFEMVSEALDVPAGNQEPLNGLLQAARNYLELAERRAAHYRLIFGERDDDYRPSEAAMEVGARSFAKLTETVARALPAQAPKKSQQYVAVQVWSLLHGSVVLRNHSVAELVDMRGWKQRALAAVEALMKSELAQELAK